MNFLGWVHVNACVGTSMHARFWGHTCPRWSIVGNYCSLCWESLVPSAFHRVTRSPMLVNFRANSARMLFRVASPSLCQCASCQIHFAALGRIRSRCIQRRPKLHVRRGGVADANVLVWHHGRADSLFTLHYAIRTLHVV